MRKTAHIFITSPLNLFTLYPRLVTRIYENLLTEIDPDNKTYRLHSPPAPVTPTRSHLKHPHWGMGASQGVYDVPNPAKSNAIRPRRALLGDVIKRVNRRPTDCTPPTITTRAECEHFFKLSPDSWCYQLRRLGSF